MVKQQITTIQITSELKNFLASQAIRKGETYDQIIKRLLKKAWNVEVEAKTPDSAD